MRLYKQAEHDGVWLFRWRSYLPLLLLLIVTPAVLTYTSIFGSENMDLLWQIFCFGISMIGLVIRAVVIGSVPKGTSGRNTHGQVAESLNTEGIYSVTRNPLYLGNYFMMLGVTMFPGNVWVCLVFTLAFWLYYERIIMAEEAFLAEKFGSAYEQFSATTPAFIPKLSNWRPAQLEFSFKNVLRREYSGFYGVVVSFVIVEIGTQYVTTCTFTLHPVWLGMLAFGTVVYITLRSLKKYTSVLHIEGR